MRHVLEQRWNELIQDTGLSSSSASRIFIEILNAYSENHRYYHTLDHLAQVFTQLDAAHCVDQACHWAVWYHDIVYQPGKRDNELRSAKIADKRLAELGVAHDIRASTVEFIMATQSHQTVDSDSGNLFLDADLSILGLSADDYDNYANNVRREYSSIPTYFYNRGRKSFIKQILAGDRIFISDFFHSRYEERARENLAREISRL